MNDLDPYRSALIGNGQTACLVHEDATIVWACMPTFEHSAVFARLLDPGGGHFAIEAVGAAPAGQSYLPLTNVLVTRFEGKDAVWEVIDWMPRQSDEASIRHPPVIHRLIRPIRGTPQVRVRVHPRPDFGARVPVTTHVGGSILYDVGDARYFLHSNLPLSSILAERPVALHGEAAISFSMGAPLLDYSVTRVRADLQRTREYWERWSRHCSLPRDYQGAVLRSALALKLLIFEDTGAVLAAPTTSIPEIPGGVRNWDYRYCWIRDSYFVVRALSRLGHFEEQDRYVSYLEQLPLISERLQPVYAISGADRIDESLLEHLCGSLGARPVRVGNQAFEHQQNDVYGELILTLTPIFFDVRFAQRHGRQQLWSLVEHLAEQVLRVWREEDAGIWEYRDRLAHHTFSKLMCWVALDRAAQIAEVMGDLGRRDRWMVESERIRAEILSRAWSDAAQAFTGAYDHDALDAANLLMAHTGFLPADDARYQSTLRAIESRLVVDDLCFRYRGADDFGVPESSFSICTFWYIDALRLTGQVDRARRVLGRMLQRANHVGLFAEGIHPETGRMTGNFPQAYTHVALINSAIMLSRRWGDVGSRHYGAGEATPR